MDVVLQIIQTVGFPIACCVFMGFFIRKQNDEYREDVKTITEKYDASIEKFSKAIDRNTIILTALEAKIGDHHDEEN